MITKEFLIKISLEKVNEMDYDFLIPKDKDKLHDFLLNVEVGNHTIGEHHILYNQMCNIINYHSDEIIMAIEDEVDLCSYDPFQHCDADFYGC